MNVLGHRGTGHASPMIVMLGTRGSTIAIVIAVLAGLTADGAAAQNPAAGPARWDRDGAATDLDEPMDVWSARGKKLRAGQGEALYVSCHTVGPHALARPSLPRLDVGLEPLESADAAC